MTIKNIYFSCENCPQHAKCSKICWPIEQLIKKDSKLRERLSPPDITDRTCQANYNGVLAERQEIRRHRKKKNIGYIRDIEATRMKAIASLIYAGFTVREIPFIIELLDIKERRLYQIIAQLNLD